MNNKVYIIIKRTKQLTGDFDRFYTGYRKLFEHNPESILNIKMYTRELDAIEVAKKFTSLIKDSDMEEILVREYNFENNGEIKI